MKDGSKINGVIAEEKFTKDISEAGFYVEWKDAPFNISQEVKIEIITNVGKQSFVAGVVRKDENGVGFAFRRMDVKDSQWLLKNLVENKRG